MAPSPSGLQIVTTPWEISGVFMATSHRSTGARGSFDRVMCHAMPWRCSPPFPAGWAGRRTQIFAASSYVGSATENSGRCHGSPDHKLNGLTFIYRLAITIEV